MCESNTEGTALIPPEGPSESNYHFKGHTENVLYLGVDIVTQHTIFQKKLNKI